jgi:hypothetical protein
MTFRFTPGRENFIATGVFSNNLPIAGCIR